MSQFDMEAVMEIEHGFGKGSKKPVDDSAPKRPLSAYFLWAGKVRPSVIKENSDCSLGEIAKILGKKWKKVSSDERSSFEKKAEKEKKSYNAKMEKYKKTSGYKKHQMVMLAWKIHETKKPYTKDPNAPKKSPSAYMLYGASVRSEIVDENPDLKSSEIMKEQGVWWKALSTKDRTPWLAKAEAEKVKYQKKLARYMKTSDYQNWVTGRDEYKKLMLEKRNKLLGIKKRARSVSQSASAKKQKRSARRSRTPKASKRRSSKRKSSSKRRARTPKAPRKSSRSSSRRSSRRRSSRRSSRRRGGRRSLSRKSTSRSGSRKSSKRSSRRSKSSKSAKRSGSRKSSKRSSKRIKSPKRSSSRKSSSRKSAGRRARSGSKRKSKQESKHTLDMNEAIIIQAC